MYKFIWFKISTAYFHILSSLAGNVGVDVGVDVNPECIVLAKAYFVTEVFYRQFYRSNLFNTLPLIVFGHRYGEIIVGYKIATSYSVLMKGMSGVARWIPMFSPFLETHQ